MNYNLFWKKVLISFLSVCGQVKIRYYGTKSTNITIAITTTTIIIRNNNNSINKNNDNDNQQHEHYINLDIPYTRTCYFAGSAVHAPCTTESNRIKTMAPSKLAPIKDDSSKQPWRKAT